MDLCVAYQVYESAPQVWTLILQRLTSLRLWDRLRKALAVMDGHPELWSIPAYAKGKTQLVLQSKKPLSTAMPNCISSRPFAVDGVEGEVLGTFLLNFVRLIYLIYVLLGFNFVRLIYQRHEV